MAQDDREKDGCERDRLQEEDDDNEEKDNGEQQQAEIALGCRLGDRSCRGDRVVQSQERKFRATEQELTRQRSLLSPEAYAQKRKEFQLRAREAQRNVQERKRSIDRMLGMAMNKISKALLEIVAAMARERSINIVLQRPLVVYAPRQFDISAEVLRRLNKQLPSVAVQMPVAK